MVPLELTADTVYVLNGVTCRGVPEMVPVTGEISKPNGSCGLIDHETAELLVAFLMTQRSLPVPSFASK